eukprot:CAMPEP_0172419684 /NCGR_PEP_ID=MMETSP1064-20121228/6080_1 /TAXON_ID=202472 /ORGANISM="Aulacoseira subarctica , Strain CCAP 1002/5" /LENGTH=127 /DNA_ID=CAMNT_0013159265 /DNA_START=445 /DNA_END=828 /DNA_ORIENTATION=-
MSQPIIVSIDCSTKLPIFLSVALFYLFFLFLISFFVRPHESFNQTNIDNSDFADQAAAVAKLNNHSTALFIPVKGYEVPDIVKAVRNVGWNGQIIGADGWADELVLKDCGEACVGSFLLQILLLKEM